MEPAPIGAGERTRSALAQRRRELQWSPPLLERESGVGIFGATASRLLQWSPPLLERERARTESCR